MFRCFDENAELTSVGRKLTYLLVGSYLLALVWLCWSPQPFKIEGIDTPNIIYFGNLVFLLVPFNSLVSLGELTSPKEMIWVIGQNIANVFLLFPLMLSLLGLFPKLRNLKSVLKLGFVISLMIECGQLVLDYLIVANRVFEIDDLMTNTLGAIIAYQVYNWLHKRLKSLA